MLHVIVQKVTFSGFSVSLLIGVRYSYKIYAYYYLFKNSSNNNRKEVVIQFYNTLMIKGLMTYNTYL